MIEPENTIVADIPDGIATRIALAAVEIYDAIGQSIGLLGVESERVVAAYPTRIPSMGPVRVHSDGFGAVMVAPDMHAAIAAIDEFRTRARTVWNVVIVPRDQHRAMEAFLGNAGLDDIAVRSADRRLIEASLQGCMRVWVAESARKLDADDMMRLAGAFEDAYGHAGLIAFAAWYSARFGTQTPFAVAFGGVATDMGRPGPREFVGYAREGDVEPFRRLFVPVFRMPTSMEDHVMDDTCRTLVGHALRSGRTVGGICFVVDGTTDAENDLVMVPPSICVTSVMPARVIRIPVGSGEEGSGFDGNTNRS